VGERSARRLRHMSGIVTLSVDLERRSNSTHLTVHLHLESIPYETDHLQFSFEYVDDPDRPEPIVLDAFLFGFLTFAMEHSTRLAVRGPLTVTAVRNAHAYMEAWHSWLPERYRPVEIESASVIDDADIARRRARRRCRSTAGRSLSAFSGGIDGAFTALRHAGTPRPSWAYDLTDVVLVHAFDVPMDDTVGFDTLVRRLQPFIESLGLRLRIVRTDVRRRAETRWEHQNWEHSFGAQLAGVLHQFSDSFDFGLIGSGQPYTQPVTAWGSTPGTDHLLSGGFLDIVNDGAGYSRTEKVERVARNDVASSVAKVCWEGLDRGANCGRCEKCVRTRLNFIAIGVDAPACFDTPIEVDMIESLEVRSQLHLNELTSILDYADRHGRTSPWLEQLRHRIAPSVADGSGSVT
jgi:hypothetical protein